MDLELLTNEQIIEKYYELIEELESLKNDIEYNKETLDDSQTNGLLKTDLLNDLKYDNEQVEKVLEELNILKYYASKNNIELDKKSTLAK